MNETQHHHDLSHIRRNRGQLWGTVALLIVLLACWAVQAEGILKAVLVVLLTAVLASLILVRLRHREK